MLLQHARRGRRERRDDPARRARQRPPGRLRPLRRGRSRRASRGRRRTSSASTTRSSPRRAPSTARRASRRSSQGSSVRWPHPDELADARRRVVRDVVGEVDGRAAERAVDAIVEVVGSRAIWRRLQALASARALRAAGRGRACSSGSRSPSTRSSSIAFPLAAGRDLGTYLRASFELRSDEVVLPQALLVARPVTGVVSEALLVRSGRSPPRSRWRCSTRSPMLCWWRVGANGRRRRRGSRSRRSCSRIPGYVAPLPPARERRALRRRVRARRASHRAARRVAHARESRCGRARARAPRPRPAGEPDPGRARAARSCSVAARGGRARDARGVRRRRGRVPAPPGRRTTPCAPTTSPSCAAAGHGLPLYRAFVVDRIVSPENGEASRELARAVAERSPSARAVPLVRHRPRRRSSRRGSARMHEDLIGLSDRTWGWDDDYAHLARVGREAVRAHPGAYARGVARDSWRLLWWPVFLPVAESEAGREHDSSRASAQLPEPSEGQPIPSASVSGFISTPDGRFREVWTSPTEHEIYADDPSRRRASRPAEPPRRRAPRASSPTERRTPSSDRG